MKKTIYRATHRKRYVMVDQSTATDMDLSWGARGLLLYLLSLPDDWIVRVNDLKKRSEVGKDGVYRLLRELRKHGYVQYERHRDAQGRMRGGRYTVFEVPPDTQAPDMGTPDLGEPRPDQPEALPNTQLTEKETTTTRPIGTDPAHPAAQAGKRLRIPKGLEENVRQSAARFVSKFEPEVAQQIIDEWVGALRARLVKTCPLRYLKGMIRNYEAGDMTFRYSEE